MTENKRRIKKPATRRKGPIRTGGMFKSPKGPNSVESDDHGGDAVMQAYRVMEEQMRAGAIGAFKAFGAQSSPFMRSDSAGTRDGGFSNFSGDMLSQWMNLYTQMFNISMQAFESIADMRSKQSDPIPFPSGNSPKATSKSTEPTAGSAKPSPVRINLICERPAEVMVDLRNPPSSDCRIQSLQCLENNHPPISGIQFESVDDVVMLSLKIPKKCGKGTYVGAVIDSTTNTGCGTITVKL